MTRKHISCTEDAFDRCDALREGDESWSEFLHRAADALEATDGDVETDPETDLQGLVADLNATLPTAVADEVEDRLTGP